jgi:hypothetical protein
MKNISTDLTEITNAIKKSKILEVDKDEKLVRRCTPLPEESDIDKRSLTVVLLFFILDWS